MWSKDVILSIGTEKYARSVKSRDVNEKQPKNSTKENWSEPTISIKNGRLLDNFVTAFILTDPEMDKDKLLCK